MKATAIRKLCAGRRAKLFLAVVVFPTVVLPRPGSAEDAPRNIDADLNKEFLQRVRDADNLQLREQMRQVLERKAAGREPRQFQWDAVDRGERQGALPGMARPAAQFQVKLLNLNAAQARRLMVFTDGDVQVIVEAVLAAGDDDEDEVAPDVQPRPKQQFRIAPASCDQLLFGKGRDEAEARRQLGARLTEKVTALSRVCGLTQAQSQKLELAGRGDIHRFFEQTAQLRSKLEAMHEGDAGDHRALLRQVMALSRESRPLRETFAAGPFGEGTLFAKALRRMLTPEQAARYPGAGSSPD